jgi:acylphosphatase
MTLHYDIRVTGRVQGVFYRASARLEAVKLGLVGYARNEEDGSVQAEAEGEKESLDRFVAWCRQGPRHALVEAVEVTPGPVKGFPGFTVR